ncbi:MAG: hypothetical protein AB4042_20980 [Leptolyngbyaceae cyanobacterium]
MKDKRSEKQKVTLYVPPDLHHKLKIRAALDCEPMSTIAERAIQFYLAHSDVVDSIDGESVQGRSYQIHTCPECGTNLVMKEDKLTAIGESLGIISDASHDSTVGTDSHYADNDPETRHLGTEELVHC